MKPDNYFTYIWVCPTSKRPVSSDSVYYSNGVCHVCGESLRGTVTHAEKIPGRWHRPNLWERMKGKRPVFFPKDPSALS